MATNPSSSSSKSIGCYEPNAEKEPVCYGCIDVQRSDLVLLSSGKW